MIICRWPSGGPASMKEQRFLKACTQFVYILEQGLTFIGWVLSRPNGFPKHLRLVVKAQPVPRLDLIIICSSWFEVILWSVRSAGPWTPNTMRSQVRPDDPDMQHLPDGDLRCSARLSRGITIVRSSQIHWVSRELVVDWSFAECGSLVCRSTICWEMWTILFVQKKVKRSTCWMLLAGK